jgi:hypothetical protein
MFVLGYHMSILLNFCVLVFGNLDMAPAAVLYVGLIPMVLSIAKDMHLCLCAYVRQRNLCIFHASIPINLLMFVIFFPVQRHEDSGKLACWMYLAASCNQKLLRSNLLN